MLLGGVESPLRFERVGRSVNNPAVVEALIPQPSENPNQGPNSEETLPTDSRLHDWNAPLSEHKTPCDICDKYDWMIHPQPDFEYDPFPPESKLSVEPSAPEYSEEDLSFELPALPFSDDETLEPFVYPDMVTPLDVFVEEEEGTYMRVTFERTRTLRPANREGCPTPVPVKKICLSREPPKASDGYTFSARLSTVHSTVASLFLSLLFVEPTEAASRLARYKTPIEHAIDLCVLVIAVSIAGGVALLMYWFIRKYAQAESSVSKFADAGTTAFKSVPNKGDSQLVVHSVADAAHALESAANVVGNDVSTAAVRVTTSIQKAAASSVARDNLIKDEVKQASHTLSLAATTAQLASIDVKKAGQTAQTAFRALTVQALVGTVVLAVSLFSWFRKRRHSGDEPGAESLPLPQKGQSRFARYGTLSISIIGASIFGLCAYLFRNDAGISETYQDRKKQYLRKKREKVLAKINSEFPSTEKTVAKLQRKVEHDCNVFEQSYPDFERPEGDAALLNAVLHIEPPASATDEKESIQQRVLRLKARAARLSLIDSLKELEDARAELKLRQDAMAKPENNVTDVSFGVWFNLNAKILAENLGMVSGVLSFINSVWLVGWEVASSFASFFGSSQSGKGKSRPRPNRIFTASGEELPLDENDEDLSEVHDSSDEDSPKPLLTPTRSKRDVEDESLEFQASQTLHVKRNTHKPRVKVNLDTVVEEVKDTGFHISPETVAAFETAAATSLASTESGNDKEVAIDIPINKELPEDAQKLSSHWALKMLTTFVGDWYPWIIAFLAITATAALVVHFSLRRKKKSPVDSDDVNDAEEFCLGKHYKDDPIHAAFPPGSEGHGRMSRHRGNLTAPVVIEEYEDPGTGSRVRDVIMSAMLRRELDLSSLGVKRVIDFYVSGGDTDLLHRSMRDSKGRIVSWKEKPNDDTMLARVLADWVNLIRERCPMAPLTRRTIPGSAGDIRIDYQQISDLCADIRSSGSYGLTFDPPHANEIPCFSFLQRQSDTPNFAKARVITVKIPIDEVWPKLRDFELDDVWFKSGIITGHPGSSKSTDKGVTNFLPPTARVQHHSDQYFPIAPRSMTGVPERDYTDEKVESSADRTVSDRLTALESLIRKFMSHPQAEAIIPGSQIRKPFDFTHQGFAENIKTGERTNTRLFSGVWLVPDHVVRGSDEIKLIMGSTWINVKVKDMIQCESNREIWAAAWPSNRFTGKSSVAMRPPNKDGETITVYALEDEGQFESSGVTGATDPCSYLSRLDGVGWFLDVDRNPRRFCLRDPNPHPDLLLDKGAPVPAYSCVRVNASTKPGWCFAPYRAAGGEFVGLHIWGDGMRGNGFIPFTTDIIAWIKSASSRLQNAPNVGLSQPVAEESIPPKVALSPEVVAEANNYALQALAEALPFPDCPESVVNGLTYELRDFALDCKKCKLPVWRAAKRGDRRKPCNCTAHQDYTECESSAVFPGELYHRDCRKFIGQCRCTAKSLLRAPPRARPPLAQRDKPTSIPADFQERLKAYNDARRELGLGNAEGRLNLLAHPDRVWPISCESGVGRIF